MKNILLILILITLSFNSWAHEGGHGASLRQWNFKSIDEPLSAELIKYKHNKVWLADETHQINTYPLTDFSKSDQKYILDRYALIQTLNTVKSNESGFTFLPSKSWFTLLGGALLLLSTILFIRKKKRLHLSYGFLGSMLILLVSCDSEDAMEDITKEDDVAGGVTDIPVNDISLMQSLFENFTAVSTDSDDVYFYVGSNGIPDHNMMVGITSWQQQVPIEQDYTGGNSWSIPIQPELADEPLSTLEHFMKGAIAIAVNGVPIFNPLNNRGEDAKVEGELDQWGGHCGKADDYHYHLPPTHLSDIVGEDQPVAYALDGFPVYGATTDELDEYLGKFNDDGSYQYHTVEEFPYFMAGVRGVVSIDSNTPAPEDQISPQAMSTPLRGGDYGPLNGATIIGFTSEGSNARSVEYQIENESYYVNYSWDDDGLYTFNYLDANGNSTEEIYQR
ncbi:MAG: YHYH protein [Reichenbachiella sp.]